MQWARVLIDCNLEVRRGAWYRLRHLGPLQAVIELRGQELELPAPFLEVIAQPPRRWSVVSTPRDAVRLPPGWGEWYLVCPNCREREPLRGHPRRVHCPRCRGDFQVGWRERRRAGR